MILALILSAMTSPTAKSICAKHLIAQMPPELEELDRRLDEEESQEWAEARKREEEEMRGRYHDHWPRGER